MNPLSETLFPVTEVPAIGVPEGVDEKEIDSTGYKFITRSDTGDILSCMTDEYRLVTNSEIMDVAGPLMKKSGAKLCEARTFGNGARTMWQWKLPDKVKVDSRDYVNPTVTIRNSYDGSIQVHILAGAFRILCSNGMIIGIVISNKSNRHSVYNLHLDNIEEAITDTIETSRKIFSRDFPVLVKTDIKRSHVMQLIKMFPDFVMAEMTKYLVGQNPQTYWDLLNCATFLVTHHMKRNYETTHQLEHSIYPRISKWANNVARA